jgi:hypothetical protein
MYPFLTDIYASMCLAYPAAGGAKGHVKYRYMYCHHFASADVIHIDATKLINLI